MIFQVLLKNLEDEKQFIILEECAYHSSAELARKKWRRVLGNKSWTVDRRPGLDTLDHLVLTIIQAPK